MDYKKIVVALILVIYFVMSWFFPWDDYEIHQSISTSYLFDLLFITSIGIVLKEKINLNINDPLKLFVKSIFTSVIAVIIIFLNQKINLLAPFKYVDQLAIQILFLAPFVEEFVFRYAMFHMLKKIDIELKWQIVINSLLFSISHLQALWILPEDFHGFILYQVGYTFLLGWICTKVMIVHKNIIAPIIIHFIFNLMFYLAVINGSL